MGFGHGHRPKAQAVHHAGPEVFNDDVGRGDQCASRCQACGLREVQMYTALAPVPGGVGRRLPTRPAGRIDLDHIGALVCQEHPGQGPSDVMAKVDYPDFIQRARHG